MRADESHVVRRLLPELDMVLTYGGGPPVIEAYEGFGARRCVPIYNALDPTTHHPVDPTRPLPPIWRSSAIGSRIAKRGWRNSSFAPPPPSPIASS
jgi:hypothetical protein